MIAGSCTGKRDIRHKNCGGAIWVGGFGTYRFPVGIGFAERKGKYGFGVDCLTYKTYHGFCEKCKKEGHFIREDCRPRKSCKKIPLKSKMAK